MLFMVLSRVCLPGEYCMCYLWCAVEFAYCTIDQMALCYFMLYGTVGLIW
jgi:hypothetical protein